MMICVVDLVCKLAEDSEPGLVPTLPWLRQLKVFCWVHFEFQEESELHETLSQNA